MGEREEEKVSLSAYIHFYVYNPVTVLPVKKLKGRAGWKGGVGGKQETSVILSIITHKI